MVSERKLMKKIKKYSQKLEQKRSKRRRKISSSEEESRSRSRSPIRSSCTRDEIITQVSCLGENPSNQPAEELIVNMEEVENSENPNEQLLQALGEEYEENKKYEGTINNDISKRWNHILVKGLLKTEKEDIFKKYSLPENCQLLDAPMLNDEVASVISESGKTRDKCIVYQQKQLGVALSIVGQVMSNILNNSMEKIDMLKSLSDAAKLISDIHHQQTKTRRTLIAPQLDKKFLEMTVNTNRDEYLYGDNLSEKIKINKIMQQSSDAIKKVTPKPAATTAPKNINRKYSGNQSGPPRQINQQPARRAMARGGPRTRAAPPSHKPTHHSQRSERTRSARYRK